MGGGGEGGGGNFINLLQKERGTQKAGGSLRKVEGFNPAGNYDKK